jgi:hypothetical protein
MSSIRPKSRMDNYDNWYSTTIATASLEFHIFIDTLHDTIRNGSQDGLCFLSLLFLIDEIIPMTNMSRRRDLQFDNISPSLYSMCRNIATNLQVSTSQSISYHSRLASILMQTHYASRLGKIYILHTNFIYWTVFHVTRSLASILHCAAEDSMIESFY